VVADLLKLKGKCLWLVGFDQVAEEGTCQRHWSQC